jgi:hypothetical protein
LPPTPTATIIEITSNPKPIIVTPAPLPIPTLSQQEKDKIISILLHDDYLCELPCFAGINPGITKWAETKTFFESLSKKPYPASNSNAYVIGISHEQDEVFVSFYVSQGETKFIMTPRYEFPIYKLLTKYGKPDEIYIHILDVLPSDKTVPYTVYVYYKKGIVAQYKGNSDKGTTVLVCFNEQEKDVNNVFFWLWNGNSNESFESIITKYVSKFYTPDVSLGYSKLEKLSDYNADIFFDTYSDQNQTKCLELKNPNLTP